MRICKAKEEVKYYEVIGPTADTSLATVTTLDKLNLVLQLADHEIVIPTIRLNGKGKHKSQIKFLFSLVVNWENISISGKLHSWKNCQSLPRTVSFINI